LSGLLEERLEEIISNPEKIHSDRISNGVEEATFDAEMFQKLYEAMLHLVNHVELLGLWSGLYSISHPDLTANNILVGYDDPTHIVSIVDWEGTRIQPLVGLQLNLASWKLADDITHSGKLVHVLKFFGRKTPHHFMRLGRKSSGMTYDRSGMTSSWKMQISSQIGISF
jgi:aminoglycoside phosphotransferase (APT) family kinase protein